MKITSPVEKTTRLATTVNTLQEAYDFINAHVIDGCNPHIEIDPFEEFTVTDISGYHQRGITRFSVVVSWMEEQ